MTNSADPDQWASSEANWSGSTLFAKGKIYPGSAKLGLKDYVRRNIHDVTFLCRRPRWLSWMRRQTGDQEVVGSTPAEVGNILS